MRSMLFGSDFHRHRREVVMTPQRIKFIVENLTQRCDEDSRDALEVIAELQAELAIYKGRDQAKQLVIDRLKRELTAADEQLTERSITISALREKVANRESWKESPVAYEYRLQDSEWVRIVPRNQYTSTVEDGVKEIQQYIAAGYKYELRALYVGPLPPTSGEQMEPICPACKGSGGDHPMALCSVCNGSGLQTEGSQS